MIKHTMQEWADFTGCYVSKDEDGFTRITELKPILEKTPYGFSWLVGDTGIIKDKRYPLVSDVLHSLIDYDEHDYRVLVEPHTEVKE